MRYAIPQNMRYDLAAKIGLFLVGKGLKVWDVWTGRLTKAEQLEAFGFYMGKGLVTVDGGSDEISMTVKVCFGLDWADVFYVSAQNGWCRAEGRKVPVQELSLYCSLNIQSEIAA